VVVVAAESKGDAEVAAATAFVGVPITGEVPTMNPAVTPATLGVPTIGHPLPMFPFSSSFNAHASASPPPKEVSPVTMYPPSEF